MRARRDYRWAGAGPPRLYYAGYNAKDGALVWTFHTIPAAGEFGHDTWQWVKGENYGGANAWGGVTIDEQRGWVFAATGSATDDFYGAFRKARYDKPIANTFTVPTGVSFPIRAAGTSSRGSDTSGAIRAGGAGSAADAASTRPHVSTGTSMSSAMAPSIRTGWRQPRCRRPTSRSWSRRPMPAGRNWPSTRPPR